MTTMISKLEEKLMTIQTLGKLLEASRTHVGTDLEGKPTTPPYPKAVMDTGDRLAIQAKIMEFIKSIRPESNYMSEAKPKNDLKPLTDGLYDKTSNPYVGNSSDTVTLNGAV